MVRPDGVTRTYSKITTDTTTTIFAGVGTLLRVVINKDVDNGTFTVTNTAGTELFSGKTDYAGTFEYRIELSAGCKVVTSGFTGGEMLVCYDSGDWNI